MSGVRCQVSHFLLLMWAKSFPEQQTFVHCSVVNDKHLGSNNILICLGRVTYDICDKEGEPTYEEDAHDCSQGLGCFCLLVDPEKGKS